ncbi:MAG: nickel pincer cofactor biosynthesis protein LarB [Candidatus Kapaibacterium sp.]
MILESVRNGAPVDSAVEQLSSGLGFVDIGDASVDIDRERRRGVPEVIYCASKTAGQIIRIARVLLSAHGLAYGTRCAPDVAEEVLREIGDGAYDPLSRTIRIGAPHAQLTALTTGVIAAGTSDLPVAEEACMTLETFGAPVDRIYDVGVAGIHRLLGERERMERSAVLIVVAGMEGALPSVVGGLSRQPLIAVPTSVGYGAALGGFTALLGMLTSCASGITVVNIDNGFGAAMAALGILRAIEERGGATRERKHD